MEKLENLSIEEKIGQMLMVGIGNPVHIENVKKLILKYKIGGVLLYKQDYKDYKELNKVVNELRKLGNELKIPLFIAIDQEGGRVNRMPSDFENLPSASDLSKAGLVEEASKITGELLRKTGFNFNFAPVLDIKRFKENHAIGDRAFSENVDEVCKSGVIYINEMRENNVVPVIKHYPGHGATKKDSHITLPVIEEANEKLEKEDIIPFKKAIENGADVLLVGHLRIKHVTHGYPTSMSKSFVRKYIRKKLKFNGVIITDDIRMKAVRILYGRKRALKKALNAGNDIVLFKYKPKDEKILDKIIKSGKIKPYKIDKSVRRILKLKEKYKIENEKIPYLENLPDEINIRIKKVKDKIKGNENEKN